MAKSYIHDSSINSAVDPTALLCIIYVNTLGILFFFLFLATGIIMYKEGDHISNYRFNLLFQNNENYCVSRYRDALKQSFLSIFPFHSN